MYSTDDECLVVANLERAQSDSALAPRKPSDDWVELLPACRDGAGADAVARALVAREQRKAQVGVAECLVRMREIDAVANVEMARVHQDGSTDRRRIEQEEQSKRFKQLAGVMNLSVREKAVTARAVAAGTERVETARVAANERVDVARIHEAERGAALTRVVVGVVMGAVVARTFSSRRRLSWAAMCFGSGPVLGPRGVHAPQRAQHGRIFLQVEE